MKILEWLFGSKEEKLHKKEASKTPSYTSINPVDEISDNNGAVALLMYGQHQMPVEAYRHAMKVYGCVKAFDDKTKSFINLKDLGEELYIYTPEDDIVHSLVNLENNDYDDIKKHVFGHGNN